MTADEFIRRFARPNPNLASLLEAAFVPGEDMHFASHELTEADREVVLDWAKAFVRGVRVPRLRPAMARVVTPRPAPPVGPVLTPDEAATVAWLAAEVARSGGSIRREARP